MGNFKDPPDHFQRLSGHFSGLLDDLQGSAGSIPTPVN